MKKCKRPKMGQYVLLSKYGDRKKEDPWMVGQIETVMEHARTGMSYQCFGNTRWYNHCWSVSYPEYENLMGEMEEENETDKK